jgi:hypothetical protein
MYNSLPCSNRARQRKREKAWEKQLKRKERQKEDFDLYVLYFLSLLEITWIQQQSCVEGWCDGYVGFVRS